MTWQEDQPTSARSGPCHGANPGNPEHQHPKVPATGVLLARHYRKRGNSISAAEAMLALLDVQDCLDNQLMLKGTFFAIIELALFLAELHQ